MKKNNCCELEKMILLWSSRLVKIILFGFSLFGFYTGWTFSHLEKLDLAIMNYGVAFLLLIFVYLSDFKSFKGLGIEAELKEKVNEADSLLKSLRGIALPLAEMTYSTVSRVGKYGSSFSNQQKYNLIQRLEKALLDCGIPENQLEKAKADWHYYNLHDLRYQAILPIHNKLEEKNQNSQSRELSSTIKLEYQNLLDVLKTSDNFSDMVTNTFKALTALSEDEKSSLKPVVDNLLTKVEYYEKHKEHQNIEEWLNLDKTT